MGSSRQGNAGSVSKIVGPSSRQAAKVDLFSVVDFGRQGDNRASISGERHGRDNDDLGLSTYKNKMLKMVHKLIITEKQHDKNLIKEKIVLQYARHFQNLVQSNIRLPLKIATQVEDLNNCLLDLDLSVVLVSPIFSKSNFRYLMLLNMFNFLTSRAPSSSFG